MDQNDYGKSYNCDDSDKKLVDDDYNSVIKKKSTMVLQLGMKNSTAADQTPTPTRFIRNCEEVGLFQDLLNVNPFEETFRKAAEAAKSGIISSLQLSSLVGSVVPPSNGDDTLHTPQVFPNISETEPSHLLDSANIQQTENVNCVVNENSIKSQHLSTEFVCIEPQKMIKSAKPDVGSPQFRVIPSAEDNKILQSSLNTISALREEVSLESKSNIDQSPVQVLLRIPDGRLVQLSVVQIEDSDKEVKNKEVYRIENNESNVVNDNKTVVLTTAGELINGMKLTPCSTKSVITDTKQKLKQVLLGNTGPTTRKNSSDKNIPVTTEPKKVPLARKTEYIVEKQPPRTNSNLISCDDEEDDRRKKVLERNRIAAMRCREKRKCWVAELESKAAQMGNTNQQLQLEVNSLRAEVASLKSLLLAHKDCPVTQAMAQSNIGNPIIPSTTQVFSVTIPIVDNKEMLCNTSIEKKNPPTVILLNPPNVQVQKRSLQSSPGDANLQKLKKKICSSVPVKRFNKVIIPDINQSKHLDKNKAKNGCR